VEAGRLGDVDPTMALGLYALACQGGRVGVVDRSRWNADLDGCIGLLRLSEQEGSEVELEQPVEVLRRACRARQARACRALGGLYESGRGVELDRERALALYEEACEMAGGAEPAPTQWSRWFRRLAAHQEYLDSLVAGFGGLSGFEDVLPVGSDLSHPDEVLACSDLGLLLSKGGAPSELARAHEILTDTCEQGEPNACLHLGGLFERGLGVERDVYRAGQLYERACAGGVMFGCVVLGLHIQAYGWGEELARVDDLYRRACQGGDATGCGLLGFAYELGQGVDPDLNRARDLYEQACTGGADWICYFLAELYRDVEPDPARARQLYEQACDHTYMRGCASLGVLLAEGEGGPPDLVRAHELLEHSCAVEPFNCPHLAVQVASGRGVEADAARAERLNEIGCEAGNLDGCLELARALDAGHGVAPDPARALAVYHQACEGGHDQACLELGEAYLEGRPGIAPDVERGAEQLGTACDVGNREACVRLARLYDGGLGVRQDRGRARQLAESSCQADLPAACTLLGWYAEMGYGGPRDLARAQSLYQEACQGGDSQGCQYLGLIRLSDSGGADRGDLFFNLACSYGYALACRRDRGPSWE
jgi:TPR repeat protein